MLDDIESWLKNQTAHSRVSALLVENTDFYSCEIIHIISDVKRLPYSCTECDDFTLQCPNLENLDGIPYFSYNRFYHPQSPTITLFKCDSILSYNFANVNTIDLWVEYSKTLDMKKLFSHKQKINHLNLIECSNDILYDISTWFYINAPSPVWVFMIPAKRLKNLCLLFDSKINKNLSSLELDINDTSSKIYTREEIICINDCFAAFNNMENPSDFVMDFCVRMMSYNDNIFGDDL